MKQIFIVSLLLFINFTITSCDENKVTQVENKNNISIKYVSAKNIPNIINILKPNYGSTLKTSSSKSNVASAPFGSIYIENILEVIDSLGNKNYSFTLIPKKPKPNSIFNLVVNASNGNNSMAIMEYRMAPAFAEAYHNGTKTMSEFTGNILKFPFNAASNLFAKTSGYTCVQNIDEVVNCEEIIVEGGGVVGTGGGGSTTISDTYTYTGANGGTVTHNYGGGSAYWVCDRYGVNHAAPTNCGDGSGTWVITLPYTSTHKLSSPKSKTNSNCCDQAIIVGEIGVNLYDLATDIKNILGMTTRTTESLWLIRNATLEHLSSIKYFLTINNESPDSKEFMKEMITQIANNPTVYPTITPFLIEKLIDDTLLNPCSKGVFQQIKNTTNCDFANILAKMSANEYVYNTIIKSEVPPSGKPAQTIWNSPCNYTIYISTDYTTKTKLFIATSLLHEMVHTYFMSLYDAYKNENPTNPNAYDDFAYLFDFYVNKKYPNSQAASIHHQQMATDYVDAIARALQEYQTGTPVPNNTPPNQIYSDMAYGSLQDAPSVFDALFPLGNPNRQRIINRYTCEGVGSVVGSGTPDQQSPVGQPCN